MKTLIKFYPLLIMALLFSCKQKHLQTYFVSSNAHSLIDTYRDLVTQTNTKSCNYDNRSRPRIADTVGDYYCTFSAMSAKDYLTGMPGYISFTSFFWYNHNIPISTMAFRTAWLGTKIPFCFECAPVPIVNPFGDNGAAHVFEVLLVPVEVYKSSGSRITSFSGMTDQTPTNPFISMAIKASDVKKINDVWVESDGGYMSINLSAQYHNLKSSVGIVCEVVKKDGTVINCYVFNNEDNHRIVWKQKR